VRLASVACGGQPSPLLAVGGLPPGGVRTSPRRSQGSELALLRAAPRERQSLVYAPRAQGSALSPGAEMASRSVVASDGGEASGGRLGPCRSRGRRPASGSGSPTRGIKLDKRSAGSCRRAAPHARRG